VSAERKPRLFCPTAIQGASSVVAADILFRNGESVDLIGNAAGSIKDDAPSILVGEMLSLLIFQLGQHAYALNIQHVKQIMPMMKLTALPKTDPVFMGIANIHGVFVPMVNTRRCLGLPDLQPDLYTPIILTQLGAQLLGLVVDQVSGVASLRGEQIIPPEKVFPEGVQPPKLLRGIVYLSGQMVMLLDPHLLLDETQVKSLVESLRILAGGAPFMEERVKDPAASGPAGDEGEKKKPRTEPIGLREPLARALADLAEDCPPGDMQSRPENPETPGLD
jgi:purine-binding chemotaxis protein CheW